MTRARAHRSEGVVLDSASSDEGLMDTGMKASGDSDDDIPTTLSRGRGRGRARGARGQSSAARGSSRRGRGKKNTQILH